MRTTHGWKIIGLFVDQIHESNLLFILFKKFYLAKSKEKGNDYKILSYILIFSGKWINEESSSTLPKHIFNPVFFFCWRYILFFMDLSYNHRDVILFASLIFIVVSYCFFCKWWLKFFIFTVNESFFCNAVCKFV